MIARTILTQENLTNLIHQCKNLNQIKQIHANLIKLDLVQTPAAISPFISFTITSPDPNFFSYGHTVFQTILHRSTFLYNTMIRGYVQSDQNVQAIQCYKEMLKEGLIKNNYTFPPVIKAYSATISLEFNHSGLLVHSHVVKLGFCIDLYIASAMMEFYSLKFDMRCAEKVFDELPVRDVVLWTALIDGYGKKGCVQKARKLFDEMPQRNVISWSAIMVAYSRVSDFREVICLYRRMENMGLKPNESILVTALTACANLGALAQGLWIHSYAKRCKYDSNLILATSLVDMYSKCGCLDIAMSVFEEIHYPDSGAWNAIISGVALSGDAKKALKLFDKMILTKTRPTEATFVALLTACTHSKLVEKGLSLFENMEKLYKIEPKVEHYACVVDLLSRSGKLQEAMNFVEEKIDKFSEADANVWGALLGACRIYGKVDIGDKVWKKIYDLGLADYGSCVLAYNMYKEAGWESEAKSVRRLIEERRVKKKPGCSMIEVDGKVHEFLAGDLLHREAEKICKTLDSLLCGRIKLYEYV